MPAMYLLGISGEEWTGNSDPVEFFPYTILVHHFDDRVSILPDY